MYYGNGAYVDVSTPNEGSLVSSLSQLEEYDQVLFPCWGGEYIKSSAYQNNLISYANAGGRVFATHYSYTWLFNDSPFSTTAAWDANANSWNSLDGRINQTFAKGVQLAEWMQLLGDLDISQSPADFTVTNPRKDLDSVVSPAVSWIANESSVDHFPLHYTFDTPWNAMNTCGRVVFSDFHVANNASAGYAFPTQNAAECGLSGMTAQEKLLEFLLFDLSSCGSTTPPVVQPYPNPATFTRDYQGICPVGQGVVWRFFDWETVTPEDSNIVFQAQEANTEAQLTGATPSSTWARLQARPSRPGRGPT